MAWQGGAVSGRIYFTADATAPAVPATSSFDFPANTWGDTSGKFTFTGSVDTAGFTFSIDSSGTEAIPKTTDCNYNITPTKSGGEVTASGGKATFTAPALTPGYHTLYARAFDAAHNVSAQSAAYVFYVSPMLTSGSFRHEAESSQPAAGVGIQGTTCPDGGCPSYIEPGSGWSNSNELHLAAPGPAQWSTTFTTPVEADYAINAQLTTANHFGILHLLLDGTTLKQPSGDIDIDTYSATVGVENIAFGGLHLTAGTHTLTYQIVGADPAATSYLYAGTYGTPPVALNFADNGYSAGIDYFRVQPINNVTVDNLTDAMNNNGIGSNSDTTWADLGPHGDHRSISLEALQAAGFGPGATKSVDAGTIDQTTFVMPSYNSNHNDNVIAMGQTVAVPPTASANYVDLLVASTCATAGTPYDFRTQVSVNYAPQGGNPSTASSTPLPSVPDWLSGTLGTNYSPAHITVVGAPTMTTTRHGTTVENTPATLYHVAIPADSSKTITSVTLPYLGSDLSSTCNGANLHVFAISTH